MIYDASGVAPCGLGLLVRIDGENTTCTHDAIFNIRMEPMIAVTEYDDHDDGDGRLLLWGVRQLRASGLLD